MRKDKKENFKMEIVKKGLVFARIQYEYMLLNLLLFRTL